MGKTVEAQPGIASSVKKRIAIAQIDIPKLHKDTIKPITVINRKGKNEKDVIPCQARASIFFRGYFDSPAKRSARS